MEKRIIYAVLAVTLLLGIGNSILGYQAFKRANYGVNGVNNIVNFINSNTQK